MVPWWLFWLLKIKQVLLTRGWVEWEMAMEKMWTDLKVKKQDIEVTWWPDVAPAMGLNISQTVQLLPPLSPSLNCLLQRNILTFVLNC